MGKRIRHEADSFYLSSGNYCVVVARKKDLKKYLASTITGGKILLLGIKTVNFDDPNFIRVQVVECIRRLLPEDVPELDDVLNPIDNLGLESQDGVNFVAVLGKKLGFEFPFEFNPFFDTAGRSRDIGHIVRNIERKVGATDTWPRQQNATP